MALSRLGLKSLGLCMALVGLMALGAGPAQAETGAFWLVNGAKVPKELLPEISGAFENNHGLLITNIGTAKLHILCTGLQLIGSTGTAIGPHLVEPNGALLGRARSTGCKMLKLKEGGATEELKACEPHEGTEKGVTVTNNLKGLIKLALPEEPVLSLEPVTGTVINTVELGEECAFGETMKIEGKSLFKDCENHFLTDQVTHLMESYPEMVNEEGKNVGSEVYISGNKANKVRVEGSALLSLTAAHKGLTFAGHAK